ncbi:MAG: hypothetical protein K0R39_61 [Symbiobacteriaceae bacterium]|jgi:hypothetical protein|nr:hypothetical protein [Symbiobacteriaceae bacterium]
MRIFLALLVSMALFAAGCSSGSGKAFRQITYSYTGGVAGFDQSITIAANGAYTLKEAGRPDRTGRLTSADIKSLRDLAGAISWGAVAEKYDDPRVADAIFEGLSVEVGKTVYQTKVGTGGQPPSEVAQLLGKLKTILDTHK